ncbi:inositol monophosphatase family protein [Sphingomicrobium nitratireducens]|uniref:inositol monophosphatase family protein n=1 Tax=Sphingomicrobium nitratireducens TaxID=2964666 RepID=UPI00224045EB|nr:inositol monophosphatase family protein [Sphingomicrobium nitratireducens]
MDRFFFDALSRAARDAIEGAAREPENKAVSGYDPVTAADRAAERAMRVLIEGRFPDHGIWGEEYGWTREGARYHWSLDPIDGTRAFVCGLPSWAVLVGLLDENAHVAGMIDLPALDERLVAVDGTTHHLTRHRDEAVRTSGCDKLDDARLATTDPGLFSDEERAGFEVLSGTARLTRYGLDAMAYARIATGGIDLVAETGLHPHDRDALVAVVRGAGGHVGNWKGGDDLSGGDVVAAASPALYIQAIERLR